MNPARRRPPLVPGILICGGLFLPGSAGAESDVSVRSDLSLTGVEDDNLFSTPEARESDRITRLVPQIAADYRSPRLSLAGVYAFAAERYEEHPELDTSRARQHGAIDLSARPSRRVTLSLRGDRLTTLTPGGDLNLATGLAAGRGRAIRREVRPSIEWRAGPATLGSLTCTQTRDDLAGGVPSETRGAALEFERRTSPRDRASLRLGATRYDFGSADVSTAHVLSLGWERDIGQGAALALRGGPRHSGGGWDPEVSASFGADFRTTHVALAYSRALTTVIGRAGAVVTDSLQPSVAFHPRPSFQLSASPGLFRTRDAGGGPGATVYLADVQATWHLGEWLSLVGGYRRNLQHGALDRPAPATGAGTPSIVHDIFHLGLVARHGGSRARGGVAPPVE